MADLTRARIEQLLARASEPEYAGTEFTIEDYELRALCSLALERLAVQEPTKAMIDAGSSLAYRAALTRAKEALR